MRVWDPEVAFFPKSGAAGGAAPRISPPDDNFFRIISDEALKKTRENAADDWHGPLFDQGVPGPLLSLSTMIKAYPHMLAMVSPFVGYRAGR